MYVICSRILYKDEYYKAHIMSSDNELAFIMTVDIVDLLYAHKVSILTFIFHPDILFGSPCIHYFNQMLQLFTIPFNKAFLLYFRDGNTVAGLIPPHQLQRRRCFNRLL